MLIVTSDLVLLIMLLRFIKAHLEAVWYLTNTWIDPFQEKFVAAWTNCLHHSGHIVASHDESAHARPYTYLRKSRLDLLCYKRID